MQHVASAPPDDPTHVVKVTAPIGAGVELDEAGPIGRRPHVGPGPVRRSSSSTTLAAMGRPITLQAHGSRRRYHQGCRCAPCTAANTDYHRQYRADARRARQRSAPTSSGRNVEWTEPTLFDR